MLQKKSNGNEAAKYIRIAVLLIYDILAVFLAEIISIWTRFEFSLKNEQCIPFWRLQFAISGSMYVSRL